MRDLLVALFLLSLLYIPVSCPFSSSPTPTSLSVILPFSTSTSAILTASIHPPKQICHFSSLRDKMFYVEYIGYVLMLATNSHNIFDLRFLIVRYETENRSQSNSYLISLLLNYIPLCLIPSKKYSTWEKTKLATRIIVSGIIIVIDSGFYYHFGHTWFCLGFVIAESIGAILVRNFSERVRDVIKIISGGSNLVSAMILIIGFLWNTGWNYAKLEVLIELATIARILYGFLLVYRSTIRGVLLWGWFNLSFSEENLNSVSEENLNGERRFRSLGDIRQRIKNGVINIRHDIGSIFTWVLGIFWAVLFKLGWMRYPPAQGEAPLAQGGVPPQDHRGEVELV